MLNPSLFLFVSQAEKREFINKDKSHISQVYTYESKLIFVRI